MSWQCAAIDHGITIFPNGKIGPCCQIGPEYLKSIDFIKDPARFQDLKTSDPPHACRICVDNEKSGIKSYRQIINLDKTNSPGIQFLDIRNTNLCNLKCRYCGPHFSNQWAIELGIVDPLKRVEIQEHLDHLLDDSLRHIYFTGGEPMINADHWSILDLLINKGMSGKISLRYNTNLTTLRYKDLDIEKIWQQFKYVDLMVSIDAIGEPLSYIRSGANWEKIDRNIMRLVQYKNINLILSPVISILNIWFLPELYKYAKDKNLKVSPIILHGPDYLALDVIPDQNKLDALSIVEELESIFPDDVVHYRKMKEMIKNNINHCLFQHTLNHILLLDRLRGEKMFDLLPFASVAQKMILENNEYREQE